MAAEHERVQLAIAIPAFGRAAAIATSLAGMAEEARREGLGIAFYVSDDTPNASLEEALQPLIEAGFPIHYRRNTPSLRHDRNLLATLSWPDADYVWLLGSGFRAVPGQLSRVVNFLDNQDLIFLNAHADDHRIIPLLQHDEARALLRNVLWHQTLTGATIYGPLVRDWMRSRGNDLVVAADFPQISVMMGYASTHDAKIGWLGEHSLQSVANDTPSYWRTQAIKVFVHHWAAAITAFPVVVPPDHRSRVIREHSARTDLFNTTNLIELRQSGQFGWMSLQQKNFRDAMHLPMWKLLIILTLPIFMLRVGSFILGLIKQWLHRR